MNQFLKMENGMNIPAVAFGTWRLPESRETTEIIKEAVRVGYRHIDTAAKYENERSVGQAIRECGVPREELFITSKLRNTKRGYETTIEDCNRALDCMGLEYLDMYMIHWPAPAAYYDNWAEINAETWRAMEDLAAAGKIRALGISNFKPHQIDRLLKTCHISPAALQIKLQPGVMDKQREVMEYCRAHHILVEAYSPLGAGSVLKSPVLEKIGQRYGKTPAQLCIRWCLQRGALPLPKSSSSVRMSQNLDVFDFSMTEWELCCLDNLPGVEVEIPDSEQVWRD